MLKKSLILCLLLLGFSATPWAQGGGMSDKQVLEYVEMGMKQGKNQQQIATELARRGVTRAQAERVKKLYEQELKSGKSTVTTKIDRKRDNLESDLQLMKKMNLDADSITVFKQEEPKDQVFGRNIFNTKNLTFEPSSNLPTPSNYRFRSPRRHCTRHGIQWRKQRGHTYPAGTLPPSHSPEWYGCCPMKP